MFAATKAAWQIDDLKIMPFGKQKGLPLEQVETGMLRWWLKKMDSDGLRVEYREAVTAVLQARGDRPPEPGRPPVGTNSTRLILAAEFRCMIKAWFGQMSKRYHPDRGGSDMQQLVVNDAYKSLMAELEKWEKGQ